VGFAGVLGPFQPFGLGKSAIGVYLILEPLEELATGSRSGLTTVVLGVLDVRS
jgi:hypothetical protein